MDKPSKEIELNEVSIQGETYFRISNMDHMRPFFMTIISDSDHWMFIGSNGGLTAGRKNAEFALFPYYTEDKIIESVEHTGSKSIFRVSDSGNTQIWEPFSHRYSQNYKLSRNIYKNFFGNKVIFEEINHDLELTFRYQWNSSDLYGFVRKCTLESSSSENRTIELLDGLQNIMPAGVGSALQNQTSVLVDAYKRNELIPESGIGIFGLSAIIVDKAEPSESLRSNIVWSFGMDHPVHLLSSRQLDDFRRGRSLVEERDVKGLRGSYFISSTVEVSKEKPQHWNIVASVNQGVSSVIELSDEIKRSEQLTIKVEQDIERGSQALQALAAASDAFQFTADSARNARHFSNTLFNIMRGGIFDNNYQFEKSDLLHYLSIMNREVEISSRHLLEALPSEFSLTELREVMVAADDPAFVRLCTEYLPLKFSRRHGDPSRPWNRFSINTRDINDGSKILDYEGNWRDIFQNWEALAHSYPEFIEGMIFRFLNASTFDGYNPYRITKHGLDWERIEPDDPWSYIGYWGDHQVIYLLKFLEFIEDHYPGRLQELFKKEIFVYSNVPYRIKPYEELLRNPKDTIVFDHKLDLRIQELWASVGADAVLLRDKDGSTLQVNLLEKLLAMTLSKLSNFIPGAGIWMNTQRPEWNDANNALVGNGVSMVTLYYLNRFLRFFRQVLSDARSETTEISVELKRFFEGISSTLEDNRDIDWNDKGRKKILDGLGTAGSNFREGIYGTSLSGEKASLELGELDRFLEMCIIWLERSTNTNRRSDGLYHAYNLASFKDPEKISVTHLDEMLEGQVAVLSSGSLSPAGSLEVLDALKKSRLFREDQYSYILYPNKDLSGFLDKNNIPSAAVERSELLRKMISDGDKRILERDVRGVCHFNGNFRNAGDLSAAIDGLTEGELKSLASAEKELIMEIFEEVFNHGSFTGRSGTFFGYEGLGSIYWHMVSKLCLAVQECCVNAIESGADDVTIGRLLEHYYEINAGLGVHKSPELYGAFPTDAYSHTPIGKGAQQPGMTGQVKEDILCRIGELGVQVENGTLSFRPGLLRRQEFLTSGQSFAYIDLNGKREELELPEGSLFFTYCQVPVIYRLGENTRIKIEKQDGSKIELAGNELDRDTSRQVFCRSGVVKKIDLTLPESQLR